MISKMQETGVIEKFTELFNELEDCDEDNQKQKIEEMNTLTEKMDREELKSIFTLELFNEIHQMIEEKKLQLGNAILLLKHVGYWKVLINTYFLCFKKSLLNERFERMILEEEKKRNEKNEILLDDLCECCFLLKDRFSTELLSICVPCLLKAASKKDENEETQKEVEMALLALSNLRFIKIEQELFLNEIKEIIKYHQEHHNLTHLAYQYAWMFLIHRFVTNRSLEDAIVDELRFPRAATRELEALSKCVDWKKKEEVTKRVKEVQITKRWVCTIEVLFSNFLSWKDEFMELICCIVGLCRVTRENEEIQGCFRYQLLDLTQNETICIEDMVKSGYISLVLEDFLQSTLNDEIMFFSFDIYLSIFGRLNKKMDDDSKEEERLKNKIAIFEKMEEEGYEDIIISFHETLNFLNRKYGSGFSLDIADYFVNV
ncbi:uncharacterized protein MONOS_18008 [Monocercomonoides exilis]|uniref:uncharacterized protein n=1 Tax=Monocercomonoides exilis TaxID=2049356 RepID=UPI00355A529F|nr:hypothetical protein MONOS_18008 [Monocercomonoides exilis]